MSGDGRYRETGSVAKERGEPAFQPYASPGVVGEVLRWPRAESRVLEHPRDILVWLPPGYHDEPQRRYPVLYLQDGQNKFDPATAYVGEDWNADGIATSLIARGEIEPIIMVALYNSPDRLFEYNPLHPSGRAYGRFIVQEVMPLIDSRFRTEGGRRNALMGSSMGGLISLALLWWYSEHFFGAASLSPSLWVLWREGGPEQWLSRFPAPRQPSRFYVDHGTAGYEGRGQALVEQTLRQFRKSGFEEAALHYHVEEGGEHNEISWRGRLARPLRFLFGDRPARDDQAATGGPLTTRRCPARS